MWRGTKRWAAALLLGAALAQPAQALPGAARHEPAMEGLGRLWEMAATWLQVTLDELTSDRGSSTDPNGARDHGAMTDPNGATADSDHGAMTDPDG